MPPALLTGFLGYSADPVPAVVSLITHPARFHWSEFAAPELSKLARTLRSSVRRCAPMWAFDTWLAQTDHGDDSNNVIVGRTRPSSKPAIVFLDFANSMGFDGSWSGSGWRIVRPAPFPALMRRHLDPKLLKDAIGKARAAGRQIAQHARADEVAALLRESGGGPGAGRVT